MNNYYCELKLPAIVSNDTVINKIFDFKRMNQRPYSSVLTEFNELLNPDLLAVFNSLQVKPIVMIAFGHQSNIDFVMKSFVHTDLHRTHTGWIKVPFAINWEVYDTSAEFKWYDTLDSKECYPPDFYHDNPSYLYGNGINYVERYDFNKLNPSENFKPIESCTFKHMCATMVNTSMPHSVVYSGLDTRLNISLRFDINAIPSWESALEKFKSYIF